ncbi:MAG: type II toxin-antitoxin system VapC family toxin [Acidobacteriaceae bacterium]|jgi:tRNA(fMet)-specific endonuclease VapC
MLYLLDTDTCAFIARQKHPKVTSRFRSHRAGDLAMSVVTYGELRVGAEKSDRYPESLKALELFIQAVPVLAIDPEVARLYSKVRLDLEQRGQIIGANDLWIASHCLQLGLTLVTNNEREFSRIPNLTIENWTR